MRYENLIEDNKKTRELSTRMSAERGGKEWNDRIIQPGMDAKRVKYYEECTADEEESANDSDNIAKLQKFRMNVVRNDCEEFEVIDEEEAHKEEVKIYNSENERIANEVELSEHTRTKANKRWEFATHIIKQGNKRHKNKEKLQASFADDLDKCKEVYEQLKRIYDAGEIEDVNGFLEQLKEAHEDAEKFLEDLKQRREEKMRAHEEQIETKRDFDEIMTLKQRAVREADTPTSERRDAEIQKIVARANQDEARDSLSFLEESLVDMDYFLEKAQHIADNLQVMVDKLSKVTEKEKKRKLKERSERR